jgi:transposase-like protein
MGGKTEVIENTAINTQQSDRGVFAPADVLAEFNAEFLDEMWCRAWVLQRLHRESPRCPGCEEEIPDRLMQSFCETRRIRCDRCEKYFTALTGTFLSGCHFSFREIVLLAFMLALGIRDKQIAATLKISVESVRLWRHRFNAIARANNMVNGDENGN